MWWNRLFLLVMIFSFLACESTSRYFRNRMYDTTDLVTIGIEKKSAGVSLFVWCIGGGLKIEDQTRGFGLRDGHLGIYEISDGSRLGISPLLSNDSPKNKLGNSFFLINSSGHFQYRPIPRSKEKDYQILNLLTIFPIASIPNSKQNVTRCNSPLKVETSIAFYYGMRVGMNFSELFDFIVGFIGFDPLDDDEVKGE